MRLTFRPLFRSGFLSAWDRRDSRDGFASTFVAKCDFLNRWECCVGAYCSGSLVGATVLTVSRKVPTVANLQLMHVFAAHRGKSFGREMLAEVLGRSEKLARYFRVSSESDAVGFYRACGLKFWGEQKSGCLLCVFRFGEGGDRVYDIGDGVIRSAVFAKTKGGVRVAFPEGAV